MPSQGEMQQLRDEHTGLQLWSAIPPDLSNPPILGEVVVVAFDDVVKALAKVRNDALQKAFEAVEDLVPEYAYNDDISAQDVFDAIDALRGES